ncbi:MAG TPA: heme biosynthesis HemY N-terminal domain-containing protein [Parvibaculum sp.]|uniref:heme biosynthesis protein HemY n=1 Tax=Parvibaculum sp. TaxID=2024848 RepID=UPI002B77DC0B|nr:heme biosynthesis HemY N-terminal domain-containing protein [Parvibaculum sp.]HMM14924.1 heme biosynthesis HemY N-terminal domain-containing protein [Parvibaculum sp.]
MLRALYIFLVIAALSVLAIWLADNPGDLVLHWRGYEVRTSFVVGLGLMVLVAFLVLFIYRVTAGFLRSPAGLSSFLDMRRRRRGYLALSRGMVAVAAGDAGEARRFAGRAQRLLDGTPLTLLLAAQAAQLEGKEDAASEYFEAMLASPETAFLGLRGLFVQARRAGDRDRALELARRAFSHRPKTLWAAQAVFEIETSQEDWDSALQTLDRMLSAKLISRDAARRRRAVLLTAQALTAEEAARGQFGPAREGAREKALSLALKAVSLMPDFVPAVALAARLCGETGRVRRGAKLIEDLWARTPHPDLADAYMNLVAGESAYDRCKRVRLLVGRNRNHIESRVALARAAIGARDWLTARGALEPLTAGQVEEAPTQRICELMAEIEEGEHGNRGSAREWLARALHAPEDAAWTGEGYRSRRWSAINPVTGEFDALEWKAPGLRLPSLVAAPAPEAAPETTPPATPEQPLSPVPQAAASAAAVAQAPAGRMTEGPEALAFPPLLPDDPGPLTDDAEEEGEPKW